jgi:hypothetical protein
LTTLELISTIAVAAGSVISALALLAAVFSLILSQEAQRDVLRPIITIIEEELWLQMTPEGRVNLEKESQSTKQSNVGSGLASRIQGVIFGPDGDDPFASDRRLSLDLCKVLPAGASYEDSFSPGRTLVQGSSVVEERRRLLWWRRRKYTLWVPRELSERRYLAPSVPRIIARFTLTYHDVYGRKHASIYDLTELRAWQPVAFLKNIRYDLDELNRRDTEARRPRVVVPGAGYSVGP